jgi:hypothetical protein
MVEVRKFERLLRVDMKGVRHIVFYLYFPGGFDRLSRWG